MAINVLRGRSRHPQIDPEPEPLAIGEIDREIFGCPVCSRPLAAGSRRCPGCRTRLAMGMPLRRVSTFVALGVMGTLGIAITAVTLFSVLQTLGARAAANDRPSGTSAPPGVSVASPASTQRPGSVVPLTARTALDQAAGINHGLAAAAPKLQAALGRSDLDSVAVAGILRDLAADATFGSDLVPRVGSWTAGADVALELEDVYGTVRATARAGLAASLTNDRAYRAAAQRMIVVLRRVPPINVTIRALAADAGIELPSLPRPPSPAPSE